MDKQTALREFLLFGSQRDEAMTVLAGSGTEASYTLTRSDLKRVLNKFMQGEIDADDLEMWALFVENRDEIHCEEIEGYVYALANAELMGEVSGVTVRRMLETL